MKSALFTLPLTHLWLIFYIKFKKKGVFSYNMFKECDIAVALHDRDRVSPKQHLRWLQCVQQFVTGRYNDASKPLNAKVQVEGISYSTVYAVRTARLGPDILPFTDDVPNIFVAKYVPSNRFGEREVEISRAFSDSLGLHLYSSSSLEAAVELAFEEAQGTLSDLVLLEEISFDSTEAFASIAYKIAEVLYALEERQVVHSDIKPDNIFVVTRNGKSELRLGDFEWSLTYAEYDRLMKGGDVLFGTQGFYPPEFFTPERLSLKNPRAHDMFSYGNTLYDLIFGSFPGGRILATRDPRGPSRYDNYLVRGLYHREMQAVLSDADIIPDLKEVILRAAHPRPQRRYQSFADVLRKLEKYT